MVEHSSIDQLLPVGVLARLEGFHLVQELPFNEVQLLGNLVCLTDFIEVLVHDIAFNDVLIVQEQVVAVQEFLVGVTSEVAFRLVEQVSFMLKEFEYLVVEVIAARLLALEVVRLGVES